MPDPLHVVVAHPHVLLVEAIERAITSSTADDVEVALAHDADRVRQLLDAPTPPAVLALGAGVADAELLAALARLERHGTRVVALTHGEPGPDVVELLLHGACSAIDLAELSGAGLVRELRDVTVGEATLAPAAVEVVLAAWRRAHHDPGAAGTARTEAPRLTTREQEVLDGLAEGRTVQQIAGQLSLAPKTVENHKTKLFATLGVSNQAEAVDRGHALGLLGGRAART